jgi:hypothetical protein
MAAYAAAKAGLTLFLPSGASSFITGATMLVDGGVSITRN